jgi:hypothetical protein
MWHVVNGRGLKVGHAASRIARLLIGKHKPTYNPACAHLNLFLSSLNMDGTIFRK